MPLIDKNRLVSELAPPLNASLASSLLDEFVSLERRYILRDWEPAELDAGQFCELLARIFYHLDSGNLNLAKGFDECMGYLTNEAVGHGIVPRHNAIHLVFVLRAIYKFRSQRGAVHISPSYQANQMDARFMMEGVRWGMNETLRLFWRGDREAVARAIRELLQFEVPCVGKFENVIVVQRTDLTAEEELLVLLHYAGEQGMSRKELGQYAGCSAASVTRALQALASPCLRQAIEVANGQFRLSDLGSKRVRENLAEKLVLE